MNGNSPHSGAPISWKTAGSAVEEVVEQDEQHDRHDEQQRDRARVAADLPQHPRGRRPGDAPAHAASRLDHREEGLARSCSPVSCAEPSGVV